jgi:dolichyl-phosphate beta-glucosyltransferase
MSHSSLSIVIPVYNSRDFIEETVSSVVRYLAPQHASNELIVVDDGSTDGTGRLLERVALAQPMVKVIGYQANRGKGFAVRKGVAAASGDRIVFTDADLAYPVDQIGRILASLDEGSDLAIATRVSPDSRYIMSPQFFNYVYTRHLGSRVFNLLVRSLLDLPVRDCQAGLKGFTRSAAQVVFPRLTLDGFAFDIEVLCVAKTQKLRLREVPVEFRYFSEPTTVAFMRDSVRALADLVRVKIKSLNGDYSRPL